MTTKLHQIIAVEKGIKQRAMRFLTDAYKNLQKPSMFDGFSKKYLKKDEDGEDLPAEQRLVQLQAEEVLEEIAEACTEYFDIVATKDSANCMARADVTLDGDVLLHDVPATHLLFLEKQLVDMSTAIDSIPTLDPAHEWSLAEGTGLFRSDVQLTTRTKKVPKPIVLYDATPEHPAQTQLVPEDLIVGTWEQVKHSGAMTADRKKVLQKRVRRMLKAVKYAREEANSVETEKRLVGERLFGYLFSK